MMGTWFTDLADVGDYHGERPFGLPCRAVLSCRKPDIAEDAGPVDEGGRSLPSTTAFVISLTETDNPSPLTPLPRRPEARNPSH